MLVPQFILYQQATFLTLGLNELPKKKGFVKVKKYPKLSCNQDMRAEDI